jgi:hypothetical protein
MSLVRTRPLEVLAAYKKNVNLYMLFDFNKAVFQRAMSVRKNGPNEMIQKVSSWSTMCCRYTRAHIYISPSFPPVSFSEQQQHRLSTCLQNRHYTSQWRAGASSLLKPEPRVIMWSGGRCGLQFQKDVLYILCGVKSKIQEDSIIWSESRREGVYI